jgi:hypothetical protein
MVLAASDDKVSRIVSGRGADMGEVVPKSAWAKFHQIGNEKTRL